MEVEVVVELIAVGSGSAWRRGNVVRFPLATVLRGPARLLSRGRCFATTRIVARLPLGSLLLHPTLGRQFGFVFDTLPPPLRGDKLADPTGIIGHSRAMPVQLASQLTGLGA